MRVMLTINLVGAMKRKDHSVWECLSGCWVISVFHICHRVEKNVPCLQSFLIVTFVGCTKIRTVLCKISDNTKKMGEIKHDWECSASNDLENTMHTVSGMLLISLLLEDFILHCYGLMVKFSVQLPQNVGSQEGIHLNFL